MITVKEVYGLDAEKTCAFFNLERGENERVFRLSDGRFTGVGLTRYQDGAVRIRVFKTDGPPEYDELLLRTLLYDASRMIKSRAVIEQDGDYKKYGFEQTDGQWTNTCDKIVFPHECKGEV